MNTKKLLEKYIKENYEKNKKTWFKFNLKSMLCFECDDTCEESLDDFKTFIENNKKISFKELLFNYIDNRNLKDADVYNKVHIDRRLFNKIKNVKNYKPVKENIILLGFSLELSIDELLNLLEACSYTLAYNNYFDLIIRFCFINKIYDIKEVNELLRMYKCKEFSY